MPDDLRATEAVQDLAGYGCATQMHVVRLLAPQLDCEDHTKDIDFSPSGIRMRWDAGYEATKRALARAAWQGQFDPLEGVILHQAAEDTPLAAE
jgi:NTE family protein